MTDSRPKTSPILPPANLKIDTHALSVLEGSITSPGGKRRIRPPSTPLYGFTSTKSTTDIRQDARNHIKKDNESLITQWSRLREAIHIEDRTRDKLMHERELDARTVPIAVQKLIRTLKSSVHKIMRAKGGTPYSIIRQMFLYWDREKTGMANEHVLVSCMNSLGVKITHADLQAVLQYYAAGHGHAEQQQMSYQALLKDFNRGEPALTVFVDPVKEVHEEDGAGRYELQSDQFKTQPAIVRDYIEAVRIVVPAKMRREGGTMFSHVRRAFLMSDYNYSSALDASEFVMASKRGIGLDVSLEQACEIIKFYDRHGRGECDYRDLLRDIVANAPTMLQFVELSPRTLAKTLKKNASNPFLPTTFRHKPNKLFESVKVRLHTVLTKLVAAKGGSFKSWLRDAFHSWDPRLTGKVQSWRHIQGALRACGLMVSQEEADCMIDCFSRDGTHECKYDDLVEELAAGDHNFLHPVTTSAPESATARAPENVSKCIGAFYQKVLRQAALAQGTVQARDLLQGTFLRFDSSHTGRVSLEGLRHVAAALKVTLAGEELPALLQWFDSDGSGSMDYREFIRQLFGDDILTKKVTVLDEIARDSDARLSASGGGVHRNILVFESRAQRDVRRALKLKRIVAEKVKLQSRLDSVELQSKALLSQYTKAKMTTSQKL